MADVTRALIVDEDPDSRVALRRALQRAQLQSAGEVGFGTQAVSFALEARPDVILLGVEEPAARPLDTVRALTSALPKTPIIVYSSLNEAEAVRRSMVLGVRDYLLKPVQAVRLREAAETALAYEKRKEAAGGEGELPHGRGTVITVTGAKGGVGKSVIAVNLALSLRRETDRRVAILDADDEFGDVATLLDLTPQRTVANVLAQREQLDAGRVAQSLTGHESGLEVLAAAGELDVWQHPEDVQKVIDLLARTHDFVIIDTGGSFDALVRKCIEASTLTLVVTSGEVSSVRDTTAALRRLANWGVDAERVKLVLNRTKSGHEVTRANVEEAVKREVFWDVPFDGKVTASVQLGQPIVLQGNSSRAARSLTMLARSIAGTRRSLVPERDERKPFRERFRIRRKRDDATVAAVGPELGGAGGERPRPRGGLLRFLPLFRRRGVAPSAADPRS